MDDLGIGDEVHVGRGVFEPVYSFGHRHFDAQAKFLNIKAGAATLEVSEAHLVFVQERGAVPAGLVHVGESLLDSNSMPVVVESVTPVDSYGIFAPFTASGKLVVGGVLVSSFVALELSPVLRIGPLEFSYHWLEHSFEVPHRAICHYFGCLDETYDEAGVNTLLVVPLNIATWILQCNSFLKNLLLFIILVVTLFLHSTQLLRLRMFL